MLKLVSVVTSYGRTNVLHGVSLHVRQGEIVALVGANGAGKTTLLNTISGIFTRGKGSISSMARRSTVILADRIVRLGSLPCAGRTPALRATLGAR